MTMSKLIAEYDLSDNVKRIFIKGHKGEKSMENHDRLRLEGTLHIKQK